MRRILTFVLVLALCCSVLGGCGSLNLDRLNEFSLYHYDNADRYTAGGTELSEADDLKSIEVSWIAGDVRIGYHDGGTVLLTEESESRELTEENSLHWYRNGSELTVQFAADGWKFREAFRKSLTILLPKDFRAEEWDFDLVSADLNTDALSAEEIELSTVSGSVSLSADGADQIQAESVSGDLRLVLTGKTGVMRLSTVSGSSSVDAAKVRELAVTTVSGDVSAVFAESPKKAKIDAASAGVELTLPKKDGFTLTYSTVSGDFSSELAVTQEGKVYEYGDGGCELEVKTVSGDVRIHGAE